MADTKEKPIPLKPHEVRDILDGRQSQLRRIMKGVNAPSTSIECKNGIATISTLFGAGPGHPVCERVAFKKCPYGQPGDRLWVRETFSRTNPGGNDGVYFYKADGKFPDSVGGGDYTNVVWKPCIHMPRTASRILLEITDVRVERLQDISEEDAIAEGVTPYPPFSMSPYTRSYRDIWESLNGPGSWEANPWVWVIGFKVVEVKG